MARTDSEVGWSALRENARVARMLNERNMQQSVASMTAERLRTPITPTNPSWAERRRTEEALARQAARKAKEAEREAEREARISQVYDLFVNAKVMRR